ncbi:MULTISPECIES: hypothetical protein [Thalassomonas]|uniref:Uncharacterized protein n=1 Tax=Thalassomonas actiniarum TaxID=485447 RepID=A0AAF0BWK9_9GAMM|nr:MULTISPECIES: hypothetical protein [Thalassomonas]WDD96681.1 hypothetical protein SG35_014970 [Thalassomonas actiniarum]
MSKDEFERMNLLSEKALHQTASSVEMEEFHQLLQQWNVPNDIKLAGNLIDKDKDDFLN